MSANFAVTTQYHDVPTSNTVLLLTSLHFASPCPKPCLIPSFVCDTCNQIARHSFCLMLSSPAEPLPVQFQSEVARILFTKSMYKLSSTCPRQDFTRNHLPRHSLRWDATVCVQYFLWSCTIALLNVQPATQVPPRRSSSRCIEGVSYIGWAERSTVHYKCNDNITVL